MLKLIWLIPLLPAAGVLFNGAFGRKLPLKAVGTIACLTVLPRSGFRSAPCSNWRSCPRTCGTSRRMSLHGCRSANWAWART